MSFVKIVSSVGGVSGSDIETGRRVVDPRRYFAFYNSFNRLS